MKSTFTLLIGIILYSLNVNATTTSNTTVYFICNFSNTVTTCEINQLEQQGFQIFETDTNQHVVYVKSDSEAIFTKNLKAKMKELIKVDSQGNRVHLLEEQDTSPDFLRLFFNFI